MKKDRVALRFALIVGLVILLPFVLVLAFGGIGVMRGAGRVAGVLWTANSRALLYALIAATIITAAVFVLLRGRRRTERET